MFVVVCFGGLKIFCIDVIYVGGLFVILVEFIWKEKELWLWNLICLLLFLCWWRIGWLCWLWWLGVLSWCWLSWLRFVCCRLMCVWIVLICILLRCVSKVRLSSVFICCLCGVMCFVILIVSVWCLVGLMCLCGCWRVM